MEDLTKFLIYISISAFLLVAAFIWFFVMRDFTVASTGHVLATPSGFMFFLGFALFTTAMYATSFGIFEMAAVVEEEDCGKALAACSGITASRLDTIKNIIIVSIVLGILLMGLGGYNMMKVYKEVNESISAISSSADYQTAIGSSSTSLV